jgi:hypothetical protein
MDEHGIKLKTYIQQQLQSGFSPDEIANHLRAANWNEELVHQAFRSIQSETMPTEPVPTVATITTEPTALVTHPQATQVKRGRIRTGWQLLKQSLTIIRNNKHLARYTIMASVWSFVTMLVFTIMFVSIAWSLHAATSLSPDNQTTRILSYVVGIALYIALFFVANLYNAGLTADVLDMFHGQRKPYKEYMHVARSKAGALLLFAVIEATVGLFLRIITERIRFVGWIISRLLGALWSLGTLFVVPIIVTSDQPSAIQAIRGSMSLFRKTWGEGVFAKVTVAVGMFFVYLGMIIGFIVIGALVLSGVYAALGNVATTLMAVILFTLFIITFVLLAIFNTLANAIINVALFYYATYGQVPPAFDATLLNSVFIARKQRSSQPQ